MVSSAWGDIKTGLVSHWTFDETVGTAAADSRNGNTGTLINGPTRAPGHLGERALSFDATDDYINVPAHSSLENIWDGGGTVSFWVKPNSKGQYNAGCWMNKSAIWAILANAGADAGETGFEFGIDWSGSVPRWRTETAGVTFGQWHHIVLTYNADSSANAPSLYVDGTLVGLTEIVAPSGTRMTDAGASLQIGGNTAVTRVVDGSMDDVRIYGRVLSSSDIAELHRDGLVGRWKFDEASGTTTADAANANTGTLTNGPGRVAGIIGSHALFFDGADDLVEVGAHASLANIWDKGGTVAFWVKPDSKGEASGGTWLAKGFSWSLFANSGAGSDETGFEVNVEWSGATAKWRTDSTGLTLGSWHHVVLAYDASSTANDPALFVDGVPVSLTNIVAPSGTLVSDAADDLYIGSNSATSRASEGTMDDVRLYQRCFTLADVDRAYNEGLVGHWSFDETSGTTAFESVDGNDGTHVNGPTPVGGVLGAAALEFDGADDYVSVTAAASLEDIWAGGGAVAFWVKPASGGESGGGTWLNKGGWTLMANSGAVSGETGLEFFVDWSGGTAKWRTETAGLTFDHWHHVAVVYDSASTANQPVLYVDGSAVALTQIVAPSGTVVSDAAQDIYIGSNSATSRASDGAIDDLRFYRGAISGALAEKLYEAGAEPDETAPDIDTPEVTVTQTTATISWTTNENATSQVNYGLTSSYGSSSADTNSVLAHEIVLTSLTPGTTYHYQVTSVDAASNANSTSDATFTTAGPAKHYIRAAATGLNNGTSWENAWTSFAAVSWTRGDTYYIAGGTYDEDVAVAASLSGSTWITLKKANAADNAGDTGWNSTFATAQAEILGHVHLEDGYIAFDGVTGEGTEGHGVRIDNPDSGSGAHVLALEDGTGPYQIKHLEIKGAGYDASVDDYSGIRLNAATAPGGKKNIYVGYCWIHEVTINGVQFLGLAGTSYVDYGLLFENNVVSETGGCLNPANHGQGMQLGQGSNFTYAIIRNNVFRNISGSGMIAFMAGSLDADHHDIRIYNNIFHYTDLATYKGCYPGMIWAELPKQEHEAGVNLSEVLIANNTFYGVGSSTYGTVAQIANFSPGSNVVVKNNIWENCYFSSSFSGVTFDTNAYWNNAGNVPSGTYHQVTGMSQSTFVNAGAGNFDLDPEGYAVDVGLDLSTAFETDRSGISRPQGSGWDLGAFECVP
ncbi:MAG TPA: LamG-like jellyroll fold domain-containing protein [Lacunisphaera sp.]|nr:LamG-like jellyroll fold domain-containing protein [Lacunisphaera sp.]